MSEFKVGDKVCFLGGHSLPEFFGGVYEVIGQTIAGIFNDEYVLNDKGKTRRVSCKSIRPATLAESRVGYRIDSLADQVFKDAVEHGHGFAMVSIEGIEHVSVAQVINPFPCEELGDDFPIENHISPNCQARDV
ncbi:hypothetical protein OHW04_02160 [Acinetobacter baumannii]|nr:hypothetical protein [Acinetobacter baumannii]